MRCCLLRPATVSMLVIIIAFPGIAAAQDTQAEEAAARAAALKSLPKDAARRVFGAVTAPAPGEQWIVGEYWKGCYAGGEQLPAIGDHWQVMRPSRNRNWGHPALISFLKHFADKAEEVTDWPGILIGDMSQPRGGPMLTGHASHQIGIDADIWLRPMPEHPFNAEEAEVVRSTNLLRADRKDVDPKNYTKAHFALLRAAARSPEVARVFVNAGIKKALCRDAGDDRAWLSKIRPAAGHNYHFHIRLNCPKEQPGCIPQTPPGPGDGCGKELDYWFTPGVLNAKGGPRAPIRMASMPKMCQQLVTTLPAADAQPAKKTAQPPKTDAAKTADRTDADKKRKK
jgi:penicillin-insensitive murein DD-endopeptidase